MAKAQHIVPIAPYIILKLYDFVLMIPSALKLEFWVGFFKITLNGDGAVALEHDDSGEWTADVSALYWWLSVSPFVLIPRNAEGIFYLYANRRYYEVVAEKTKQTKAYEIKADWVTRTGRQIYENTRPECI